MAKSKQSSADTLPAGEDIIDNQTVLPARKRTDAVKIMLFAALILSVLSMGLSAWSYLNAGKELDRQSQLTARLDDISAQISQLSSDQIALAQKLEQQSGLNGILQVELKKLSAEAEKLQAQFEDELASFQETIKAIDLSKALPAPSGRAAEDGRQSTPQTQGEKTDKAEPLSNQPDEGLENPGNSDDWAQWAERPLMQLQDWLSGLITIKPSGRE